MFERIYLGGTFDCLHSGHLNLFRNAHKYAKKVTVGLNTDEFATRYKRRPVISLDDRYDVLLHCVLVDDVIINVGCEDSTKAVLESHADAIGHGDDWTGASLMQQMSITEKFLIENRIVMVYLPYTSYISTTQIIERMLRGD